MFLKANREVHHGVSHPLYHQSRSARSVAMLSLKSTLKTGVNSVRNVQQVRFRSEGLNPQQERIVTQLSVISAGRKQPRILKLCNEDYVKHRTVMKAWSLIRKNKKEQNEEKLRSQYQLMEEAANELKAISSPLYAIANEHQYGKRFPLEMRVPTEYPPRQIWFYDYFPKTTK